MKVLGFITASLMVAAATAGAAESKVVVKEQYLLSMQDLKCITRASFSTTPIEDRSFTLLEKTGSSFPVVSPDGNIELKHNQLSARGCDITKIDKVFERAHQTFGIIGVWVDVTKEVSESHLWKNKCLATYTETLDVSIGEGIVLTSKALETRPATDCK